jgi:hypothetical protein
LFSLVFLFLSLSFSDIVTDVESVAAKFNGDAVDTLNDKWIAFSLRGSHVLVEGSLNLHTFSKTFVIEQPVTCRDQRTQLKDDARLFRSVLL